MSSAVQFYISTLLIYLGVDILACWGLNLQYGYTGLLNFAFIIFQAAGAYTAAVLTLGPAASSNGGFQQYIAGATLPFPLPLLAAGVVGGVLSLIVGFVCLRRLRRDYQAMVFLVVSLIATAVVTTQTAVANGPAGVALVPQPLVDNLNLSALDYQWFYVGLTLVMCAITYFFVHRITSSPFGRSLRAIRENPQAAAALGRNVGSRSLMVFVIGGVIAAISGAILVQFIGAWAPGSWLYPETFVLFTALIVGGSGNNMGALLGALMVPVAFVEGARYLPDIGHPGVTEALQWIATSLLVLLFLWFRPKGLVPERRRRFPGPSAPVVPVTAAESDG